jgi:hypothetical protein
MWGKKTKSVRISRQPSRIQIIIYQKELESVEYFRYYGNVTTNDTGYTQAIKSRIAMAKAEFNKKTFSPSNWT